MRGNRVMFALVLALLVGACAPVTTYTDAEAPKRIKLDSSTAQIDVRFAPGGAALSPADAARLQHLAASGAVGPGDRVIVAAAGNPALANQRVASVATALLRYGIVVNAGPIGQAPANHASIEVTRTLVTLPPCPNWSKPSNPDFGNQPSSNFGCATETNLGMMIANPADLAGGLPAGPADGRPASAAVNRYLNDKVVLPNANTALPVAVQSPTQQGSDVNPNSPTGVGAGTGGS
jgi:pilus assembly protein CpaD